MTNKADESVTYHLTKTIYLYDEEDYPVFQIDIEDPGEYRDVSFKATVYEINTWDSDTKKPYEPEHYMKCFIKWDSCAHVYFGEPDEDGSQDGYIHFCGLQSFQRHAQLIDHLYRIAFHEMGREPLDGEEANQRTPKLKEKI